MSDRIACTDATGAVGIVTCAEYPDGFYGPLPPQDPGNAAIYARLLAAGVVAEPFVAPAAVPPDCGSLAFWLTALDLWMRDDGQGGKVARTADEQASIQKLVAAGDARGTLAARQFSRANTVLLADLVKIAPAFGFSAADCTESLWRADQVRQGDLSGVWPLTAST